MNFLVITFFLIFTFSQNGLPTTGDNSCEFDNSSDWQDAIVTSCRFSGYSDEFRKNFESVCRAIVDRVLKKYMAKRESGEISFHYLLDKVCLEVCKHMKKEVIWLNEVLELGENKLKILSFMETYDLRKFEVINCEHISFKGKIIDVDQVWRNKIKDLFCFCEFLLREKLGYFEPN